MKKRQLEKEIEGFDLLMFRVTLSAFSFAFFFINVRALLSSVAGALVGSVTGLLALIITIHKRKQCDNVSTRHAGSHAGEQRKSERFTNSKELPFSENRDYQGTTNPKNKSNQFPASAESRMKNTN